jgi:ABC-type amino acid transport substrate-binding protein
MKASHLALIAAVSCVVAFVTSRYLAPQGRTSSETSKESTFDRVVRTNTLRCGYGIWEPEVTKDAGTGKLGGIFYDYLNAIAQHTGLKVEWTEEVPWGDFPAALNSGRIDAGCFGAWPKATSAREVLFTEPTYYLAINAYVKASDSRFDHAIEKVDVPDVKISTMDSELSSELARTRFPHAQTFSISQMSDASTLLLNVSSGKADVTFTDGWTGSAFMEKNPGQLKMVPLDNPLRLFGNTIMVAKGEHSLVSFINTATDEIIASGEMEAIVRKYEKSPGILLMKKTSYQ